MYAEEGLTVFLCEGKQFGLLWRVTNICIWALKTLQVMEGFRKVFYFFWNGWLNLFFIFTLWILKQLCSSPMEIIKSYLFIYLFWKALVFACFMPNHFNWSFRRLRKGWESKSLMQLTILSGFASKEEATLLRFMYLSTVYACSAAVVYLRTAAGWCKEMPSSMVWAGSGELPNCSHDKCSTNFWPPSS